MGTPNISVAICTRNRSTSLATTLASLERTSSAIDWEIIVVDNASDDDTLERLRSLSESYSAPFRFVLEPEVGLAKARNRALLEARSDVVLFLDDDVTCEPGVVEAHLEVFKDSTVLASGGRIIPDLPEETPDWFRDEVLANPGGPTARYDFGDQPGEIGSEIRPMPIGAHFAVRRQAALAHGGFSEELGWGKNSIPGEETRLMDLIRADRGRIIYVPQAIVHHRIAAERTTFAYFDRWFERLGRFEAIRAGRPAGRARLQGIARAAGKYGKWRLRLLINRDTTHRMKYRRRLARARGRWLELLKPSVR